LRSKKRKDFDIWSRIVGLHASEPGVSDAKWEALQALRNELQEARQYV
jgi:hypothetical protein